MPSRSATVASRIGLHARPASAFARVAMDAGFPITLTAATGKSVNAASIVGILSLGIRCGEIVTVSANDDGAAAVLDALVVVLATDFDDESASGSSATIRL
jgi:phosphocarrier protein HPr